MTHHARELWAIPERTIVKTMMNKSYQCVHALLKVIYIHCKNGILQGSPTRRLLQKKEGCPPQSAPFFAPPQGCTSKKRVKTNISFYSQPLLSRLSSSLLLHPCSVLSSRKSMSLYYSISYKIQSCSSDQPALLWTVFWTPLQWSPSRPSIQTSCDQRRKRSVRMKNDTLDIGVIPKSL